ncbi:MAG: RecQ family zinc-binding domain-containing protein, partial [Bacteroidia bacterium]|nr:RecQ family zinc-binding domain-containing protein [Bacteroidia bacterium]
HIDEAFLSKQLGCSQDEIVRQIQHLAFESLLEYQPRSNHPQITLLRERVAAKNLTIDLKSYKLRKKRKLIAAKAITSYLKTTSCRQQYILRYFGEYGGKPCGICDRCQRETSPDGNVNEIIDLILNDFKSRSFQKQELLALQYPKSIVDDALNHLLDEGKLDIKGNSFNWR